MEWWTKVPVEERWAAGVGTLRSTVKPAIAFMACLPCFTLTTPMAPSLVWFVVYRNEGVALRTLQYEKVEAE